MQFDIPLKHNPLPYQNYIRHTGNRRYKLPKLKQYQEEISYYAIQTRTENKWKILDKPFKLEILFLIKGKRRGDIDNMAKGVIDALEGILFTDDKQCYQLTCIIREGKDFSPSLKININSC